MKITAEFISPADHRWLNVLKKVRHDVYHLPEYVSFAARHEGGKPLAFYAEANGDFLLIPLILRKLPADLGIPGWHDVSSPYGYPCPLWFSERKDHCTLNRFLSEFIILGQEMNMVSGFIRLHPLLNIPLNILENQGSLVRHGNTIWMDLTQSEEEIWRQTRENHRRGIRKLDREGFSVEIDNWSHWNKFQTIYLETMDRLSADSFYCFSEDYFEDLRAALKERLHLGVVLSPVKEVAAAGIFAEGEEIIEYHLGGTSGEYLKKAPSKLLFHIMRLWAKNRGATVFHLGGGMGSRQDSLFNFKAGFSKNISPFFTFRIIFDQSRFDYVLKKSRGEKSLENIEESNYFPPYRIAT